LVLKIGAEKIAVVKPERAKPFFDLVTNYPDIIMNNRLGGGVLGDTAPASGIGSDWVLVLDRCGKKLSRAGKPKS